MEPETTSTELALIDDPEQMVAVLRGQVIPAIDDPEVIQAQIRERILGQTDAEAILDGLTADKAQDVVGQPFRLHGVRLAKSAYDQGLPVFALLAVTYLDDDVESVVTCSANSVVTKAVQLARQGLLPRNVVITKADKATAAGFYPLDLRSA